MPIQELETKWSAYLQSRDCPKVLGLAPVSNEDLAIMGNVFRAHGGNSDARVLGNFVDTNRATAALWIAAMSARAYDGGNFWGNLAASTGYQFPVHHRQAFWATFRSAKGDGDKAFKYIRGPLVPNEHQDEFLFQAGLPLCHCPRLVGALKTIERRHGLPETNDADDERWLRERLLEDICQIGTLRSAFDNQHLGPALSQALLCFLQHRSPINLPEPLTLALAAEFTADAQGRPKVRSRAAPRAHALRPEDEKDEKLFLSAPRLVFTDKGPRFVCEVDLDGLELDVPAGCNDARLICGSAALGTLLRATGGPWRMGANAAGIQLAGPSDAEVEIVAGNGPKRVAMHPLVLWHSGALVSRYGRNGELHLDAARRQLPEGEAFSLVAHPQAMVSQTPGQEAVLRGGWKVWHFAQGWTGEINVTVEGDPDPWWSSAWVATEPVAIPEEVTRAGSVGSWWLELDPIGTSGVTAKVRWNNALEVTGLRAGLVSCQVANGRSANAVPLTEEMLWHGCPIHARVSASGRLWRIATTARAYMRDEPLALLRDHDGQIRRLHSRMELTVEQLRHARILLLRRDNEQAPTEVEVVQGGCVVGQLGHRQGSLSRVIGRGLPLEAEIANQCHVLTDGLTERGLIRQVSVRHGEDDGIARIEIKLTRAREVSAHDELVLVHQVGHAQGPRIAISRLHPGQARVAEDAMSWSVDVATGQEVLLGVALAFEGHVCGSWLADEDNCRWSHAFNSKELADDEVRALAAFAQVFHAPLLHGDHVKIMQQFFAAHLSAVLTVWAGLADRPHSLVGLKIADESWPGAVAQLSLSLAERTWDKLDFAALKLPPLVDPWLAIDLAAYCPWAAKVAFTQLALDGADKTKLKNAVWMQSSIWLKKSGIAADAANQRIAVTAGATHTPIPANLFPAIQRHLWSADFAKLVLLKMLNPAFSLQ